MEEKEKTKLLLRTLLLILCYILTYGVLSVSLRSFHADPIMLQMLSGMVFLLILRKRAVRRGEAFFREMGLRHYPLDLRSSGELCALGFLLNCAVGGFINLFPFSKATEESYRAMSSAPVEGVKPVLAFFIIAFMAPVIEEMIFRGVVLRRLSTGLSPITALSTSALLFGVLHGQLIWILYAVVLGLVLGLMYLIYDSIYPSILLHISFNLVSGIPMLMNKTGLFYRLTYGNKLFLLIMLAGGAYGTGFLLYHTYFPKFLQREAEQK